MERDESQALARCREAALDSTAGRERLRAAMREASREGESLRSIGEAVGLSRSRVYQIIHEEGWR